MIVIAILAVILSLVIADCNTRRGFRRVENARKVDALCLEVCDRLVLVKKVGAADNLVEPPETELRHAVGQLTVPIDAVPPTEGALNWREQTIDFVVEID